MFVLPGFRGLKIGRRLLDELDDPLSIFMEKALG